MNKKPYKHGSYCDNKCDFSLGCKDCNSYQRNKEIKGVGECKEPLSENYLQEVYDEACCQKVCIINKIKRRG